MTNKPAQVTEAHRKRAIAFIATTNRSIDALAQLIAYSEANAVAEAERRMDEEEFKPCSAFCDQLRAEVTRLKEWQNRGEYAERFNADLKAELAKERARLDFMNTRGFEHRHHETGDWLAYEWTITSAAEHKDVNLRDTIDAAMKEESK